MGDGKHKGWLPEVGEPLGITRTVVPLYEDGGEGMTEMIVSPGPPERGVWLEYEGRRFLVADEHLAYGLAGARKARATGAAVPETPDEVEMACLHSGCMARWLEARIEALEGALRRVLDATDPLPPDGVDVCVEARRLLEAGR